MFVSAVDYNGSQYICMAVVSPCYYDVDEFTGMGWIDMYARIMNIDMHIKYCKYSLLHMYN